jgi:hypothetical protein
MNETIQAFEVAKEAIPQLTFPKEGLGINQDELKRNLTRATTIGNTQKGKVKIYFEDSDGLKVTSTTIWAVTKNDIVLKKGVNIPINRIVRIDLHQT